MIFHLKFLEFSNNHETPNKQFLLKYFCCQHLHREAVCLPQLATIQHFQYIEQLLFYQISDLYLFFAKLNTSIKILEQKYQNPNYSSQTTKLNPNLLAGKPYPLASKPQL